MSMSSSSNTSSITRNKVQNDLSYILTLPPTTLTSLAPLYTPSRSIRAATDVLTEYPDRNTSTSESGKIEEMSQDLVRSYINDMRGGVLSTSMPGLGNAEGPEPGTGTGMGRGGDEELGKKIDQLREEGEGLKAVLKDINIKV